MGVHPGDGAALRTDYAPAVTRIAPSQVAASGVAGASQHHVHEGTAPLAPTAGGIGADVLARLIDHRVASGAAIGRVRMRLSSNEIRARLGQPRILDEPGAPARSRGC